MAANGKEEVLSSLDELTEIDDIEYKEVEVPQWKRTVRLGSLTAGDLIEFVESNEGPARRNAGIRLLVKSFVDKDGNRIGKPTDIAVMQKRNHQVVNMLVNHVLELNGINKKEQEKVKNASGEANTGASPTVLH